MGGMLRRRRNALVFTVFSVGCTLTVLALVVPVRYRSTATLRAEGVTLPEASAGFSARLWAEEWVRARASKALSAVTPPGSLPDREASGPGSADPVEAPPRWPDPVTWEVADVAALLPQPGSRAVASVVFRVGFVDVDPAAAREVVREVSEAVSRWDEPASSVPDADPAGGLEGPLAAARARLHEREERVLAFVQTHLGEMPEHTAANLQIVAQLRRDLQNLDTRIQTLRVQKTGLEERLAGAEPMVWADDDRPQPESAPPGADLRRELLGKEPDGAFGRADRETPRASSTSSGAASEGADARRARLGELQSQLAALQRILGPSHPDVLSLAVEVSALTERLRAVEQRQPPSRPRRPVPNPEHQQLQAQLSEALGQLAALEGGRAKLGAQLQEHEGRLARAPAVEREHRALVQERDEAGRAVADLERRQETARAAAKGAARLPEAVRVSILEPASLPTRPLGPSRALLMVLGWTASLAAGLVVAGVRERMDDRVASPEQAARAVGLPLVAMLPCTPDEGFARAQRVRRGLWALGGCILLGSLVVCVGVWGPRLWGLWGELAGPLCLGRLL